MNNIIRIILELFAEFAGKGGEKILLKGMP